MRLFPYLLFLPLSSHPCFLALLLFQTYATEAKEFGTAEDIREAQEMAAQWLPDKKQQ
jgi:hypothetical protein